MPTVRLTGFFSDDDGHGWSEQHDVDGGVSVVSLVPFINNFDNFMATKRKPLLAGDGFYLGCRASYKTADGRIAATNIIRNPPLRGVQTFGGENVWMDAPEVAVKIRMANGANTANSDIYLRGVWDECVRYGICDFTNGQGAQWKSLAEQYVSSLISLGYGWTGINPATTPRGNVTGYTINLDGTITFNVTVTNAVALPAAGTKVQVIFSRINDSDSVLNRALVCVKETGDAFSTVQKIAAGAFISNGTFIVPQKGFIPYASSSYFKLARRKTGRPFGLTPGRSRARALS